LIDNVIRFCFGHLPTLDKDSAEFDHQIVRPHDVDDSCFVRPHDEVDQPHGKENVCVGKDPHESVLDPGINEVVHQYGHALGSGAAILLEFNEIGDSNEFVSTAGFACRREAIVGNQLFDVLPGDAEHLGSASRGD
jgi:hypothetical protein